ncbi:MAG TPA: molecular chaperone HtpG [Myxococcales bacterium]|nr:molecular chaperone HtpG [Myxococcales bacterium]
MSETHQFQAEISQLLRLVVESLYSHKEVFLRELVSNASDALDKLKFEAIAQKDLLSGDDTLSIRIIPNADAGTLTIEDFGIGMSKEELLCELGTIARSGSKAFVEAFQGGKDAVTLIGQFGVGFYSAYLVADKVEVVSKRAGTDKAHRWTSDAKESFTIEDAERDARGTAVILHLREEHHDLLDEWSLKELIRRYSDFVSHPIELEVERPVESDEEGVEATQVKQFETVNQASALWTRAPEDVTQEQYNEFYKHLARDWDDPLAHIRFKIEGTQLFTGLVFIPKSKPLDLYSGKHKRGVQLYVKRVFIMEDCEELLPVWLRFMRGVVDSDDLPLNVSREVLQDSAITRMIRKQLIKKTLDLLEELAEKRAEDYLTFWQVFGAVLKEGLHFNPEFKERLAGLVRYESSKVEGVTGLAGYVERMAEDQPAIYYIVGDSRAAVAGSPHLEALESKGYEVLYMTDTVDEWAVQELKEFDEKPLLSAAQANLDLNESTEEKEAREARQGELGGFTGSLQDILTGQVKEVRLSSRLTDSPCCLVIPEGGLSSHLEQVLRASGAAVPENKRILEINPDHTLIKHLEAAHVQDAESDQFKEWVELLYEQALLVEGSPIDDPNRFAKRVISLMEQASLGAPA